LENTTTSTTVSPQSTTQQDTSHLQPQSDSDTPVESSTQEYNPPSSEGDNTTPVIESHSEENKPVKWLKVSRATQHPAMKQSKRILTITEADITPHVEYLRNRDIAKSTAVLPKQPTEDELVFKEGMGYVVVKKEPRQKSMRIEEVSVTLTKEFEEYETFCETWRNFLNYQESDKRAVIIIGNKGQ